MPRYNLTIAANVRCYACVTVEAEDEDAAIARAQEIAASEDWTREPEMDSVTFDPEWDSLDGIEALEDFGVDELTDALEEAKADAAADDLAEALLNREDRENLLAEMIDKPHRRGAISDQTATALASRLGIAR